MLLFLIHSTYRVLGLKFLPPLLLISCLSLIISLSNLIYYSKDYLNGSLDMVIYSGIIMYSLKNLPLCSLLSFPFINYGSSMTLISIKYNIIRNKLFSFNSYYLLIYFNFTGIYI